MSVKTINLKPVEMTDETMEMLEAKRLIIRLAPGRHSLDTKEGNTESVCIYASAKEYGAHKLIGVTVNRTAMPNFGTHPDNEEFMLLGNEDTKPMYIVVALCMKDELNAKIKAGTVSDEDFITLKAINSPPIGIYLKMP